VGQQNQSCKSYHLARVHHHSEIQEDIVHQIEHTRSAAAAAAAEIRWSELWRLSDL